MSRFIVNNIDQKGFHRRVQLLDDKGSKIYLNLHRFAQITKDDILEIDPEHPSKMWVVSSEDSEDKIQITPHFEVIESVKIGATEYKLKLTEITTQSDLDEYIFLESFHYRSSVTSLNADEEDQQLQPTSSGGRKAVILCYLKEGLRWQAVGYIELQMPLMMAKPRHELFSAPFTHPSRPVSWEKWGQESMKAYVNHIVRIARVVVAPEFRGLGIAKILIRIAKKFSKERWHIRGKRPVFIEITAEMLRYVDFVSFAGIEFIGETEGNQKRVCKDLKYMQREYDATSGIMTLQKKYLTKLRNGAKLLNQDINHMLEKLEQITIDISQLKALPAAEYYLYKSILRLPIPYHLGGLDDAAERYISEQIEKKQIKKPLSLSYSPTPGRVNIKGLTVISQYHVPNTPSVRTIMDCFGLEGEDISRKLFDGLDIEASGGNIIFISGPSGSGKSLLLKAIDPNFTSSSIRVNNKNSSEAKEYSVGWLRHLPNEVPLIEYFSERWGMEKSLKVLNQVGLAEVFVYIKPYDLLSRGQRYRARLAELLIRDEQVWLIDEFCADLDPQTARIVAHGLRKLVINQQRIAFVAAANHRHFLDALKPTRVISLRGGTKPKTMSFREYWDEFCTETG